MTHADLFEHEMLMGVIVGSFGTIAIELILYEVYCSVRERRARAAARAASIATMSAHVRSLREECRTKAGDYPRSSPDEDTRPMEILIEKEGRDGE